MAIPTVFDITFGCGHAGQVDAADRAADQRGPWISYLSSKGMCPDCFETTPVTNAASWPARSGSPSAAQKRKQRSVCGKPR